MFWNCVNRELDSNDTEQNRPIRPHKIPLPIGWFDLKTWKTVCEERGRWWTRALSVKERDRRAQVKGERSKFLTFRVARLNDARCAFTRAKAAKNSAGYDQDNIYGCRLPSLRILAALMLGAFNKQVIATIVLFWLISSARGGKPCHKFLARWDENKPAKNTGRSVLNFGKKFFLHFLSRPTDSDLKKKTEGGISVENYASHNQHGGCHTLNVPSVF